MRPPLAAPIVRKRAAIQSRAAKMPCVGVDVVSEKSLRVPNATSRRTDASSLPALTACAIAAIGG